MNFFTILKLCSDKIEKEVPYVWENRIIGWVYPIDLLSIDYRKARVKYMCVCGVGQTEKEKRLRERRQMYFWPLQKYWGESCARLREQLLEDHEGT